MQRSTNFLACAGADGSDESSATSSYQPIDSDGSEPSVSSPNLTVLVKPAIAQPLLFAKTSNINSKRMMGSSAPGRSSLAFSISKSSVASKRKVIPIRQAAVQAKKAKWTECIAAAHIVQDETRAHIYDNSSDMDPNVLAEWTGRITKVLVQQNAKVLDNLDALTAAKTAQMYADAIRINVNKLKNSVRSCESEQQALRDETVRRQRFNGEINAASRFLKHIDRFKHSS